MLKKIPLLKLASIDEFNNKIHQIEEWSENFWLKKEVNHVEIDPQKEPYYVLSAFPYPSGQKLHVGHAVGYVGADICARFERLRGKNVFQPFGFDSFGLPAEQYAIATGQHPEITTQNNIANMITQLNELGMMIDWRHEIRTSDPSYYKWTQWIFLKFYEHFFDETEIWDDGFGNKIQGRAKHVSVLIEWLKEGKWGINTEGYPEPKKADRTYTQEEIDRAVDNARLAYVADVLVNWCPKLGTVLADEEVIDGRSERGNFPVVRKKQRQWMMRITKYAKRLADFTGLDWPQSTIDMQKDWIKLSRGMEIDFKVKDSEKTITIYTTKPETILGVSFIGASRSMYPSIDLKEGEEIFTGEYAIHPMTKALIPIWVANFVLDDYGTGYVMGVPAHDSRDFSLAVRQGLEITPALRPTEEWLIKNNLTVEGYLKKPQLYCDSGDVITSAGFIKTADFIKTVPGRTKEATRLRDWIFSRQRYWGEPFPVVHCPKTGKIYAIEESDLPIRLPKTPNFKPSENEEIVTPLERCNDWIEAYVEVVDGKAKLSDKNSPGAQKMRMDPNTMPNWAGSCWYYLGYLDPENKKEIFSREIYDYWSSNSKGRKKALVDLYIGGAEHAVLHYMYSRFWHKFLFDIGVLSNPEPYSTLIHQGLITTNAYFNENRLEYVSPENVELKNDFYYDRINNEVLQVHRGKMGKSYKNGRECGEVVSKVGASVLRLYLMYMSPLTDPKDNWDDKSMIGMSRFLRSVFNAAIDAQEISIIKESDLHLLIKEVTEAYESHSKCNIVIAKLIEFFNKNAFTKDEMLVFLQLLAPAAPHFSDFLYNHIFAEEKSIFDLKWPEFSQELIKTETATLLISLNGRCKKVVQISPDLTEEEILALSSKLSNKYILKRIDNKVILNFLLP